MPVWREQENTMSVLRVTRDVALSLAGLAVLGGVIIYFAMRPTEVVAVQGRDLFLRYCASCHGVDGKGNGPAAAALQPSPADLTRLSARYGDEHPLRQTIAAIDGRRPVRAHGDSAMPVWGQIFERDMEEQKIGWPKATTIQQLRLIAEYVLTLQQ
jgi:mono/diheme cytochrome c family protein